MYRLLKRIVPLGLCLAAGMPLAAQDLRLSLEGCVRAALDYSPPLRTARFDRDAASAQASARKAALLPALDLDGHYDYIANVLPAISLPANIASDFGISNLDFGYHNMWSIGLSANWDIFGIYGNWRQAQAAERANDAAKAQLQDARTSLLLKVRLAYFQTQLAESQVRLYAEALRLSQSQLHDLDLRLKAGSSSRIDWLTASNDELDQRASLRLAQVTL
ncbi:MAG: TolC family protein, partial [bacterium]